MYHVSIELYKHEWKFGKTRNTVGGSLLTSSLRQQQALVLFSIELYKHDF